MKLAVCFAFAAVAAAAASYQTLGFLEFPPEVKPGPMSGVDIDRKGNVYVLHRGDQPLAKFNSKGKHVKSWGAGIFKVPHGIRIGPDGNVWTTDNGSHVLRVFTPDGELVRVIGEPNVPGSDDKHLRAPDDIVFASNRHFYVADAGNGRIVHFDADGKYLTQWGKKGKGTGEFSTAHSMTIDKQDRIYVGDRGNKRIQVFDQQGKFLHEWTGFGNPFGLVIAGPNMLSSEGDTHEVFLLETATGKILEKWGGSDDFQLPHLMSIDKNGKIYLAEVNGKRIRILARKRQ